MTQPPVLVFRSIGPASACKSATQPHPPDTPHRAQASDDEMSDAKGCIAVFPARNAGDCGEQMSCAKTPVRLVFNNKQPLLYSVQVPSLSDLTSRAGNLSPPHPPTRGRGLAWHHQHMELSLKKRGRGSNQSVWWRCLRHQPRVHGSPVSRMVSPERVIAWRKRL